MEAEIFGRYKLVSLLGEGGMAKVYLAVLSGPMGFEKEVALKKIDARLTQDDRFVKALINEARLGGQLRHKNIVEVYEFNQVGEDYYLAMEYVNGWTLDSVVRNCRNAGKQMPPGVVLQIACQICRGLEYAHSLTTKDGAPMNLVHRDLKPGNVILSRGGDAKIMDFGIAKADSNLYKTTAADITKGTPIYMSPEQVTGSSKLSGRSDIFSMGSIVHEMLCLDVIFHGDNLLAIMHKVLQADIRDAMNNVRERVPGLEAVISKAMAKKPEDRYESAGAMEKDLQGILDSLGNVPTVNEWLLEYGGYARESEPKAGGGEGAAPPKGTESLPDMYDPPDSELGEFTRAFFARGEQIGQSAPKLSTVGPTAVDPSADPSAEAEMGELTKQFFQTSAATKAHPEAIKQKKVLTPTQPDTGPSPFASAAETPPYAEPKKDNKTGAKLLIVGLIGLIVLLLLAVAAVVGYNVIRNQGPDIRIPTDPTESITEPVTEELPTAEPPTAEPPTAEPPTAEPPTAEPPTAEPPTAEPPTAEPPTAEPPTPEPPTPEPVATGDPAYMTINAKPWATIYLDGKLVGNTPKKKHEITPGAHTVVLKCGPCSEPQEQTLTFTVNPGDTYVNVRNEFTP